MPASASFAMPSKLQSSSGIEACGMAGLASMAKKGAKASGANPRSRDAAPTAVSRPAMRSVLQKRCQAAKFSCAASAPGSSDEGRKQGCTAPAAISACSRRDTRSPRRASSSLVPASSMSCMLPVTSPHTCCTSFSAARVCGVAALSAVRSI